MRVKIAILLFVAVLVAGLAACGDDAETTTSGAAATCTSEDPALAEPGFLTIATGEPAFPPWIVDDDPTNQQGFEGALAYAIAAELGFGAEQVKWVRTGFDEAIAPGPKSFDFNLQQYSITAERDEVVDFSIGYYTVQQALVAYADSPVVSANTAADLKAYRLGAAIGTTSFDYIEQVIQPSTRAAAYDTNADAKSALDAKQIDALVFDLPTAFYITAVEIPEATIVGVLEAPGGAPEEFGLLFADGSPLVSCVNAALQALIDDGTLATLQAQWIAGPGALKVITP
jgi:polar amino acid transport system substrate-binding protein